MDSDERIAELLNQCNQEARKKVLDLMSYSMGVDPKGSFHGDPWSGEPGDKSLISKAKALARQLVVADPGLQELVDLVMDLSLT